MISLKILISTPSSFARGCHKMLINFIQSISKNLECRICYFFNTFQYILIFLLGSMVIWCE